MKAIKLRYNYNHYLDMISYFKHSYLEVIMGFIRQWFGFNGWKELSTRGSIFATIFYRVMFVAGLAVSIMVYSYASGGEDPSSFWILIVGLIWFLIFQFLINLIFVNGSR